MLKGFPCLVTEAATTKNNKGAVKTTLAGNDIFTSKKYEEVCPASSTVQVPILKET
jgi:translation initiation factor 5A